MIHLIVSHNTVHIMVYLLILWNNHSDKKIILYFKSGELRNNRKVQFLVRVDEEEIIAYDINYLIAKVKSHSELW